MAQTRETGPKRDDKLDLGKLKSQVDKVYHGEDYKTRHANWKRYLEEFSGKWWGAGVDPHATRAFVNFLFSTIQTAAPLLTDNRPVWNVVSRLGFMQRLGNRYSLGLQFIWDMLEMDRQSFELVVDMLLLGTMIAKVGFDPDEDEITSEVVDPFTFVVSPGYTDVWKAAWCGTITPVPYTWILTTYPDQAKQVKPDSPGSSDLDVVASREYELMNSDVVTVYELWIRDESVEKYMKEGRVERDGAESKVEVPSYHKKYPNGRILIFTKDLVLLEDKASPFRHGKPPYVIGSDYLLPHQFWGQGEADQIENLVRELNMRVQDMVDHVRKYSRQNHLMREDAGFSQEQAKEAIKSGDSVLTVKGELPLADYFQPIMTPDPNRSIMELINLLPQFIEEVSGVTDTSKGQVSKKQRQSAHELSILIESSYTRTRQKVRNLERFLKRHATLVLELMQQFYTEPRPMAVQDDKSGVSTFQLSNNPQHLMEQMKPDIPEEMDAEDLSPDDRQELQDWQAFVEAFSGEDEVYGDFIIQIETNSTLPMDQQSLANMGMKLLELGAIDPPALLKILRFPYRHEVEQRMMEAQKQQQQSQGGGNPPVPIQGGSGPDPQQIMAQMQGGPM